MSGVWRYRELLPFEDAAPFVTLFEGNTPLYDAQRSAGYCGMARLRLKHQGCNPTGSFKDTGMTAAVTQAVVLGARTAICASTGNTAASLAAYAARAGLQAAILVPHGQVSAAKLAQSMDYGAVVIELDGNFDDGMRLVQELGDDASIYVANSINPFRIEGQKTVAIELMRQLNWRAPDHVVAPGGNMGNSTALGKGFEEMRKIGLIDRVPKIHVIQAEGAAPLVRLFANLAPKQSSADAYLPDVLKTVEEAADAGDGHQDRRAGLVAQEPARGAALGRADHQRERAGDCGREGSDRARRNPAASKRLPPPPWRASRSWLPAAASARRKKWSRCSPGTC